MAASAAIIEAELADAKDRLLRALAETENVRRRADRERADASRFGAAIMFRSSSSLRISHGTFICPV